LIQKQHTGIYIGEQEIVRIQLQHPSGDKATILNYGAVLSHWQVQTHDLVTGFDHIPDYWSEPYRAAYPYFGAVIGRVANRIKGGQFEIDGQVYHTPQNLGRNTLHGGKTGFDSRIWQIVAEGGSPNPFVTLRYSSPDGEEGFPGNLTTEITYTLGQGVLNCTIQAHTDKPTPVNLAHHAYFNLGGNDIRNHRVKLFANTFLEQDADFCPTGKLLPVVNSVYDFREYKTVSQNWDETVGYDQSFVIDNWDGHLKQAASCISEDGKISLDIFTTEPIVHLYTGRWIPEIAGKEGKKYGPYAGLCFETQVHPDAINRPEFPDIVLRPGQQYRQENEWVVRLIS
jgi:aldose 1-epimerase